MFQRSEPEVTVEQETHDKAELLEKPKHCLGQMSRLNNREHSTTLRICLIGLGANTVYVPQVRSDKANETHHRQPVIQIDFSLATTGADVQQRTILTATGVQTGLATSVVVPATGRHAYVIAGLKKFVYETGRTFGIL